MQDALKSLAVVSRMTPGFEYSFDQTQNSYVILYNITTSPPNFKHLGKHLSTWPLVSWLKLSQVSWCFQSKAFNHFVTLCKDLLLRQPTCIQLWLTVLLVMLLSPMNYCDFVSYNQILNPLAWSVQNNSLMCYLWP